MIISSANDACVAIAEHIAGTPDGFVEMMNARAEAMGLKETYFVNVHGLDDEPMDGNLTSAYDLAQHRPRAGSARSRARMVLHRRGAVPPRRVPPHQHEQDAGRRARIGRVEDRLHRPRRLLFAGTAQRKGLRLISVVLGAASSKIRFQESARLLSAGFNGVTRVPATKKDGDLGIEAVVLRSHGEKIRPLAAQDVTVFVPRSKHDLVRKEVRLDKKIVAPLKVGQRIGMVDVRVGDQLIASVPAVSNQAVEARGWRAWLKEIRRMNGASPTRAARRSRSEPSRPPAMAIVTGGPSEQICTAQPLLPIAFTRSRRYHRSIGGRAAAARLGIPPRRPIRQQDECDYDTATGGRADHQRENMSAANASPRSIPKSLLPHPTRPEGQLDPGRSPLPRTIVSASWPTAPRSRSGWAGLSAVSSSTAPAGSFLASKTASLFGVGSGFASCIPTIVPITCATTSGASSAGASSRPRFVFSATTVFTGG